MRTKNIKPEAIRYLVKHIPTGLYYHYSEYTNKGLLKLGQCLYLKDEIPQLPRSVGVNTYCLKEKIRANMIVHGYASEIPDHILYEIKQIQSILDIIKIIPHSIYKNKTELYGELAIFETEPSDWEITSFDLNKDFTKCTIPENINRSKEPEPQPNKQKRCKTPLISFNPKRLLVSLSKLIPRRQTDNYCKKYK